MHHSPDSKIMVVGTKIDLRDDKEALARLKERDLAPLTWDTGISHFFNPCYFAFQKTVKLKLLLGRGNGEAD